MSSPAAATTPTGPNPAAGFSARADRVLAGTYKRPDILFVDGEGSVLIDAAGDRYLDMTAGVAVNALGHGSAVLERALREASSGLVHTSNLYHTRPAVELAERLVDSSFASKAFFCNSGAEAVEGALKFARLAAGPSRHKLVAFEGSFHGRTFGALTCTDRPPYREPFAPLIGGVQFAPFADDEALAAIDHTTAAVIVEPIQGEGGVREAPAPWLQRLRARCDEVGALLIFDEVQTGLGRTGTLWAHEPSGVSPDLMSLAKPLAGGLPMGAVLLGKRAADAVTPGCHATTFGGGPLVASVACRVFDAIAAPAPLARVRQAGERLRKSLERLPSPPTLEVRGRGLLLGVQVDVPAGEVVAAALRRRLLLAPAGPDVVRLLPPLDVDDATLERAVVLLGEALEAVRGGLA